MRIVNMYSLIVHNDKAQELKLKNVSIEKETYRMAYNLYEMKEEKIGIIEEI